MLCSEIYHCFCPKTSLPKCSWQLSMTGMVSPFLKDADFLWQLTLNPGFHDVLTELSFEWHCRPRSLHSIYFCSFPLGPDLHHGLMTLLALSSFLFIFSQYIYSNKHLAYTILSWHLLLRGFRLTHIGYKHICSCTLTYSFWIMTLPWSSPFLMWFSTHGHSQSHPLGPYSVMSSFPFHPCSVLHTSSKNV